MDALQFPARDRKVARMLSAAREQNRIVVLAQLFTWNRMAYVDVGSKLDNFGGHLLDAAVLHPVAAFEIEDGLAQQPGRSVRLCKGRGQAPGQLQFVVGGRS